MLRVGCCYNLSNKEGGVHFMQIYEYKGSWYYRFYVERNPVTGKRHREKKGGFSSEKEAKKAGLKAKAEFEKGVASPTEKITFGELAGFWLEDYRNRGHVKESSVFMRQKSLKPWFQFFDTIQIRKINMMMIQNALNTMREKYADNTLSGIFSVLKMIFKKAREVGYLNSDPTEFVYIPKKRKTLEKIESEPIESRYLEKDMLKHFLSVTNDFGLDHDKVMFRLLAYTGVRIGEALALKWSDIDFENKSISITRRISHRTNKLNDYELDTPKTKSSRRTIPIDSEMVRLLNELNVYQGWFKKKHKDIFTDLDFVFVSYNKKGTCVGYPITQKHVRFRLDRILKMANIKQKVTPHTFRHTHTSLLAEAGVDLVTIMERLGHKDDSITKDIYLHITQSLKKEAVHKFEKLMNDL
jgi:integrase